MGKQWRHFKSDLTMKWAPTTGKGSVDDTVCQKYDISKEKWTQFCQSHRDPSWEVSFVIFIVLNFKFTYYCQ